MRIKLPVLALSVLGCSGLAAAQVNQSVDIRITEAPKIVRIGATDQLVYELHLTNFSSHPLELNRLVIKAGNETAPLKTYSRDELPRAIELVGPPEINARIIPPGRRAVVYIGAPVPAAFFRGSISHSLTLDKIDTEEPDFTISGGAATPETAALPRLSPPLRGGPWVAVVRSRHGARPSPGLLCHRRLGHPARPFRDRLDEGRHAREIVVGRREYPGEPLWLRRRGARRLPTARSLRVRDDVPDPAAVKGRTSPRLPMPAAITSCSTSAAAASQPMNI